MLCVRLTSASKYEISITSLLLHIPEPFSEKVQEALHCSSSGTEECVPQDKTQLVPGRALPHEKEELHGLGGQSQHWSLVLFTSFNQPQKANCRDPAHFCPLGKYLLHNTSIFYPQNCIKRGVLAPSSSRRSESPVHSLSVQFMLLEHALTFILWSVHLTTWLRFVSSNQFPVWRRGSHVNASPFLELKIQAHCHPSIVLLCLTPISSWVEAKLSQCSLKDKKQWEFVLGETSYRHCRVLEWFHSVLQDSNNTGCKEGWGKWTPTAVTRS